MNWYEGQPKLKLTGHRSAERVEKIFNSYMVDVAYVIEVTPDAVFIVADDPDWPADLEDYDWMCSIIKETLVPHDFGDLCMEFIPGTSRQSPFRPDDKNMQGDG